MEITPFSNSQKKVSGSLDRIIKFKIVVIGVGLRDSIKIDKAAGYYEPRVLPQYSSIVSASVVEVVERFLFAMMAEVSQLSFSLSFREIFNPWSPFQTAES